ncbi:MAG: FtsQ-type POTRA domain-containing protein [Desulfobacterales bacterium]|nr:MAG: FtsQ-type POTRA domain-containing protein [Desulfobacterales bacterium]
MKRKKKGLKVYRSRNQSWFGDQLLKMISIAFALIIAGGIIGIIAYQGLSRSVFFQVEEVNIKGCVRTTSNEIFSWSGLDVKTNLWAVRIGRIRKKLESQNWIATAEVKRNWPNKLAIVVSERKPIALLSLRSGLYYIDRGGVVFAEVLPVDDRDFPVITGLGIENVSEVNEVEWLQEALDFIVYAEKGTVVLPKQNISEIHLAPEGDLVLFMADHAFPVYLGKGDMKTKYHRLSTVLSWLYRKQKYDLAASIDMNYMAGAEMDAASGGKVLVRMSDYKALH